VLHSRCAKAEAGVYIENTLGGESTAAESVAVVAALVGGSADFCAGVSAAGEAITAAVSENNRGNLDPALAAAAADSYLPCTKSTESLPRLQPGTTFRPLA
jgi:cytidine deaminase